jgi:hypothetical protein
MACDSRYRHTVILEVAATGRFIRYEKGLRYARQRVRAVRVGRCGCGQLAVGLIDSGKGLPGWRRLKPACIRCAAWTDAVTFPEFAAGLGLGLPVVSDADDSDRWSPMGFAPSPADAGLPFAVVAAEVALLQVRLDDVQTHLARLAGS